MTHAAFIGLGKMGYPMAGHLADAGLQVTVYNRSPETARRWLDEYSGTQADTPALAALEADVVFVCVGNDDDLRQVTLEDNGAVHSLKAGAVLVDHTTASAAMAHALDQACREHDARFMDAPVSGGQQGAKDGALSIMCGAEEAVFERVRPLLEHYGKSVVHMGPVGQGQLTKMANQICVAGVIEGVAEAIAFAEKAGLEEKGGQHFVRHKGADNRSGLVRKY